MKWIHNLLKCFPFSAVLFTFEACYGCPNCDDSFDYSVEVVDSDGNGIQNVEVRITTTPDNKSYVDTTNMSGFVFIDGYFEGKKLELFCNPLEGVDFQPKDTCLNYDASWTKITLQPK